MFLIIPVQGVNTEKYTKYEILLFYEIFRLIFSQTFFPKKIFEKVINKFGSSFNAEKVLSIPTTSIRAYKNLNARSIHSTIIKKLIKNKFLTSKELKKIP